MPSIFSTYSTGENRVTASVLAVLRSLSLGRIERLLAAILEESEFELVGFQNQPSKGGSGVPDAIIHLHAFANPSFDVSPTGELIVDDSGDTSNKRNLGEIGQWKF